MRPHISENDVTLDTPLYGALPYFISIQKYNELDQYLYLFQNMYVIPILGKFELQIL